MQTHAMQVRRSISLKPVKHNGQVVGLAVRRLARGGLLERLGVERGDILRTLNGYSLTALDGVLGARTQLTAASRLSLALVRNGKAVTLEYNVR